MLVKFIDVGREKKSWEATTNEVTYEWLYGQVKKNGALNSSGLDFYHSGSIRAGVREVGRFEAREVEVEHG